MGDAVRAAELLGNSAALAFIACLIALPPGVFSGYLLSRRGIRGIRIARFLILLGLCTPLPVTALAWQIVLSAWLPPLTLNPGEVAWRPWSRGLFPAGIIHGIAAWPWVVGIVVVLLSRVDRELEDQARVDGGERSVFRRVLWPKLKLAVAVSAAWVGVQAFTEIPIADAMMVRTYAEEIYTQLVGAGSDYRPTLLATLPASLVWVGLGFMLLRQVQRAWMPREVPSESLRNLPGTSAWASSIVLWAALSLFVVVPIAALVGRTAGASSSTEPTASRFVAEVGRVAEGEGPLLARSLFEAVAAALVLAAFAWAACWLAERRRWAAALLTLVCLILTVLPGPLVGLLLKDLIVTVATWESTAFNIVGIGAEFPPMRSLLYDQPSPLPMMLAVWLRYFPLAVLMVLPAFRAIPTTLWDAAASDGLGLLGQYRRIVKPYTAGAFRWVVPACTVLMLGEVSAVKIVNPPFHQIYILRLFDMMHYGAETTVAALALLQIVAAAGLCALLQGAVTWPSSRGS